MATATICKINSITLSKGEQFILPPGASIIGVTDLESLDSTCADLENVETMDCFVAMLSSNDGDDDGHEEYHEPGNIHITGFYLDNVFTAFPSEFTNGLSAGFFDRDAILAQLKLQIPAIIDGATSYRAAAGNDSSKHCILIETIPSIANTLSLYCIDKASIDANAAPTPYYVKFRKHSDLVTDGELDLPVCPISLT